MIEKKFICDGCQIRFTSSRSDEDCWKEMYELMPEAIHDDVGVLCDDCYEEFLVWFAKLTDAEKKKMRDEYLKERIN